MKIAHQLAMVFALSLNTQVESAQMPYSIATLVRPFSLDVTPIPFPKVVCGEPKRCLATGEQATHSGEFQLGAVVAGSDEAVTELRSVKQYCLPEPYLSGLGKVSGGDLSDSGIELSGADFVRIFGEMLGIGQRLTISFPRVGVRLVDVVLNEIRLPSMNRLREIRSYCGETHRRLSNPALVVATATGKIELKFTGPNSEASVEILEALSFSRKAGSDGNAAVYLSKNGYVFGYSSARLP